jgi:hypothetical protein
LAIFCENLRDYASKFPLPYLATLGDTIPLFVERKVCCSALFTNLVGWHAGAVSFPLGVGNNFIAWPIYPNSDAGLRFFHQIEGGHIQSKSPNVRA